MRRFGMVAAAAVMMMGSPASAQSDGGDRVVAAVTACRTITGEADRLACYDRAAAALDQARAAKDIVVMDRQQVRERRRSLFGLPLPNIKLFGDGEDARDEVAQIDSTIVTVSKYGRGLWTVTLADGSTWRTSAPLRFDPEPRGAVTIKRSAFGGYRGTFGRANTVQVVRIG